MGYYFGIYHWQRRFRRLLAGIVGILLAVFLWRRSGNPLLRGIAFGVLIVSLRRSSGPIHAIFDPPPWAVRAEKYERLAATLPTPENGRLLDVGCGTGRSLVGLADGLPANTDVIGLDVFDDRVILGNGPRLAARNASMAGLKPTIVPGDAARLPFATNSMDAVTACRVLHDLPKADAEAALVEFRRVLRPNGYLGVLELHLTHGLDTDPEEYWRNQLSSAGFCIQSAASTGEDGGYLRFIATTDRSD